MPGFYQFQAFLLSYIAFSLILPRKKALATAFAG